MKIYNTTVLPSEAVAIWPGSPGFSRKLFRSMQDGDKTNDSQIVFDVHVGTHFEVAAHHGLPGNQLGDFFPENVRVMKAQVVEAISGSLQSQDTERICKDTELVLFRTSNSQNRLLEKSFTEEYEHLPKNIAESLSEHPNLIGIGWDYISIEKFVSDGSVHRKLFSQGLFIIESLNLIEVSEGNYEAIVSCVIDRDGEATTGQVLLLDA